MRISDWSSDVCSSDLSSREILAVDDISFTIHRGECLGLVGESGCGKTTASKMIMRATQPDSGSLQFDNGERMVDVLSLQGDALFAYRRKVQRSEEHTSELQSLMRISYAVFCLKKKPTIKNANTST